MSLSAKYQAFLANPSSGALADNASLHYITTLTSINTSTAIIKHFSAQEKLLKKKSEKVLNTIEGANGLSVDIEATVEFVSGGGAFLPGLDDNFVADRIVIFPMIHIIHFDDNQKITQIRFYWDQGSLLKQIDVIGVRARNWPIRDGKDQAKLIASSSSSFVQPGASAAPSERSTASRGSDEVTISERPPTGRSSRSSTTNAMNDPHATLNLFQPRDVNQEQPSSYRPIAERVQSAKPPPRELSELFVGANAPSPSPKHGGASPQKERIPVKSGGGKNFQRSRLFDEEDEPVATPFSVKTNAKKYNHFEFGENEDEATPKAQETSRPKSKAQHTSQWDFEDFATPAKTNLKILANNVRHFGWSDDEEETSPVRRPIVHKPRPDADPHFQFRDDGTPDAARKAPPTKGRMQNKGMGLYQDHILHSTSDDENEDDKTKRPLGDVTRTENRKKDFDSQWEMTDDGPDVQNENGPVPEDRKKVLKSLNPHWGHYEQSPEQSKKENGIKTSGNGMGGRKGTAPGWAMGDLDDENAARPTASKAQAPESKGFWDF